MSDFSLLSYLKTHYPSVPITTVLKVMNKYENDQEMCKKALESEFGQVYQASDSESQPNNNRYNNTDNLGNGRSINSRIKELQVSHEGSSQSKANAERHVSTIERSIGSGLRPADQAKRQFFGPSVSLTVQTPERILPSDAPRIGQTSNNNMDIPQTAPPDFSSFFSRSAADIPNINCRTHGTAGSGGSVMHGSRSQQIPFNSLSATSSPVEQRRPVKVINYIPSSSSGGSLSSSATPSSKREIRTNFGDSGGICTVSSSPTMQRYGSTPNVSQHYRSEFRTEAPTPPPLRSSNIVVNSSGHSNHLVPERRLKPSSSINDISMVERRTPNPPLSLNVPSFGMSSAYSTGKLSTPVQATSPGIAHSKPVFVEIKTDRVPNFEVASGYNGTTYTSGFHPGGISRQTPVNPKYLSHQNLVFNAQSSPLVYNTQLTPEFSNVAGLPVNRPEFLHPHTSQQQRLPTFHGSPTNVSHGHRYPQFNPSAGLMRYAPVSGHFPAQAHNHYGPFGPNTGHSLITDSSQSPGIGGQQSMSSRSSSQDSVHSIGMDYEAHNPSYGAGGSHVSSLSSLSSNSSAGRQEGIDSGIQSRTVSMQEEAEYVRALLLHQKRQLQKLLEEMSRHRVILNKLHTEVNTMEKNMLDPRHGNRSFPSAEDISQLCESNRHLQTDIQLYMNEIDMYKSGQTPFNKINPVNQQNFFENMPTGQQDPIYSRSPDGRQSPSASPPPRPPPPLPARQRSIDTGQASGGAMSGNGIFCVPPVPPAQPMINSGDSEESESWSCSACTFSNHPALKKCEMCEMPRLTLAVHPASTPASPIHAPRQSLSSFPPRLAPVGNLHTRSVSPQPALDHHHFPRSGT